MPGRGKPLNLQSIADLWGAILGFPIFFGMLFGALLVVDVPEGKQWGWLCTLLFVGAFLGFCATAGNGSRLSELARRGKWAPPGATRHPALLGRALGLFLMTGGAAIVAGAGLIARLLQ